MRRVSRAVEAPAGLGIEVIAVPPGSPIDLDLMLEAVVEGVLVTGSASAPLRGECVRCLTEISDQIEVDLLQLYVHPGSEVDEEDAGRIEGDLIDLEPLLRDAVVLDLPFQPLCREECAGLCTICGANLNDHPDHEHDVVVDPRGEALRRLEREDGGSYDVYSQPQG